VLLESSGGDRDAALGDRVDKDTVEALGFAGRRRGGETGPPPLAAISQQSELADHEHLAGHIGERQIHLALRVVENPQADDLVG